MDNATTPTLAPAVFDRKGLAAYLRRSTVCLDRDLAAGRVPRGFRLGNAPRWLRTEIDRWLEAGAPSASEWEVMKKRTRVGAR